jgi:hypothetical protein
MPIATVEVKDDFSGKKSSKKKTDDDNATKDEEKHVPTTEDKEEQIPRSPGNTAHISTSKTKFSGLLLYDDGSDESDDEFDDFFHDAVPMQAAIGIKADASEPVGKDRKDKAAVKAEVKKKGTKEMKKKKDGKKKGAEDKNKEESSAKVKTGKGSTRKDYREPKKGDSVKVGGSPSKVDETRGKGSKK